jgi:hypothetical protein
MSRGDRRCRRRDGAGPRGATRCDTLLSGPARSLLCARPMPERIDGVQVGGGEMKAIVLLSPLIVGLAACGGIRAAGTSPTGGGTPPPETAPAAATSTPVPTPTPPTSYSIGDTVTTTTNATYTVTAVSSVHDTSEFGETPSAAGGYFYGVDVKICAGAAQELADPIDPPARVLHRGVGLLRPARIPRAGPGRAREQRLVLGRDRMRALTGLDALLSGVEARLHAGKGHPPRR